MALATVTVICDPRSAQKQLRYRTALWRFVPLRWRNAALSQESNWALLLSHINVVHLGAFWQISFLLVDKPRSPGGWFREPSSWVDLALRRLRALSASQAECVIERLNSPWDGRGAWRLWVDFELRRRFFALAVRPSYRLNSTQFLNKKIF